MKDLPPEPPPPEPDDSGWSLGRCLFGAVAGMAFGAFLGYLLATQFGYAPAGGLLIGACLGFVLGFFGLAGLLDFFTGLH